MRLLCHVGLAGLTVAWGLASQAIAQRGPAVVEILPIEERIVATTQATLGTIMPTRRAVIGSAVDGRVVKFLVREGDRVEEDQELASLLTATIELERDAAQAELELRKQELVELKNGSQELEIEQAKARLEATRVAAEFLEKDTRRLSQLGANSAISASEVEDSHSRWLAAQQRYIEAQAAYQLAVDGPRPEKIAQAEFRVAMQAAVLEKLQDQIAKHTMYSRFAGYVTVEHTEVGQWLPRGEPVAEIIALDEVDVLAKVIEAHIPFINVGDKVTVDVPAVVGRKFIGTVAAIIPEADEGSRTFPVKVRVANEINEAGVPLLKAGMLARVDLPTGNEKTVLMVPKDALVLGGQATLIWTIDAKSIQPAAAAPSAAVVSDMLEANAQAVPVQIGVEQNNWIEVRGDVAAGTAVVVRGNERIPLARPVIPPSRVTWRGN
ncbi:MAG: efflux RND transporter periplasmic adaptor subunit [Aureliella sp.]